MNRRTERVLVAGYVGGFCTLAVAGAWVQHEVAAFSPRLPFLAASVAPGDEAPPFTLENLESERISLADLRGENSDQIVVLEWFDPACDWVRMYHEDYATLRDLQQEFADQGVTWAAIYSGIPPEDMEAKAMNAEYAEAWGIEYPILIDADKSVAELYRVRIVPHVIVIDAEGKIRYTGAIDTALDTDMPGAHNHLRAALDALVAGHELVTDKTPPRGCTVREQRNADASPD